jgi:hypothetical protein
MTTRFALTCILGMTTAALTSCGDGVGACVSDPVDYQSGQRVYCYDGWDEADCDTNQAEQVNGADWTFYGGQECDDRDLTSGSNPYP